MIGLLLDTQVVLWMVMEDSRLSTSARREIERTEGLTYSIVSLWEIALKLSRRGFDFSLPRTWHRDLIAELRRIGATRLSLEPEHCRRLQDLPWHHKDPFDRMLIAQAQVEKMVILTADPLFSKYEVKTLR